MTPTQAAPAPGVDLRERLVREIERVLCECGPGLAIGVGTFELVADALIAGQLADLLAERATLTAERDEARAEIAAWEGAVSSLEAHIQDRIAMRDPASPQIYLSILQAEIRELPVRARQIYAATQYRSQQADAHAARCQGAAEAAEARAEALAAALKPFAIAADVREPIDKDRGDNIACFSGLCAPLVGEYRAARAALAQHAPRRADGSEGGANGR